MNNLESKNNPQKPNLLRGYFRLFGMAFIIIGHLIPVLIGRAFFKKDVWWAVKRRQGIARHLVRFLNVRIEQTGTPRVGNFLYISNHRSYIDPVCAAIWLPFVPIAKAEVGKWPILGWGARMTGVFYVKREDKSSRNSTREAARELLKSGQSVLVYPEGTTAAVGTTLPFKIGTFAVATEEKISIAPIAIEYADSSAAFVDDDLFLPHFLRVFSKKQTVVNIHFFPPIQGDDAENLAKKTQELIDNQLVVWQKA